MCDKWNIEIVALFHLFFKSVSSHLNSRKIKIFGIQLHLHPNDLHGNSMVHGACRQWCALT